MNPERDAVLAALDAFDRAFAAGDAEAYASRFAPDGRLLLLYGDPIEGREAILADSVATFATWDTSAWRTERVLVDVLGDRAWSLSTYGETLVHRAEGRRRVIRGRLLHVLRREPDGPRPVSRVSQTSRLPPRFDKIADRSQSWGHLSIDHVSVTDQPGRSGFGRPNVLVV